LNGEFKWEHLVSNVFHTESTRSDMFITRRIPSPAPWLSLGYATKPHHAHNPVPPKLPQRRRPTYQAAGFGLSGDYARVQPFPHPTSSSGKTVLSRTDDLNSSSAPSRPGLPHDPEPHTERYLNPGSGVQARGTGTGGTVFVNEKTGGVVAVQSGEKALSEGQVGVVDKDEAEACYVVSRACPLVDSQQRGKRGSSLMFPPATATPFYPDVPPPAPSPSPLLPPSSPQLHPSLRNMGHPQPLPIKRHPPPYRSLRQFPRRFRWERSPLQRHPQKGMVGRFRRPEKGDRYGPILCDLHQRPGRVFRIDRSSFSLASRRSRGTMGHPVPPPFAVRYGPGPMDVALFPRDRPALCVHRELHGRDAELGHGLPRTAKGREGR
jgi:hypothetical protein